MSTVKIVLSSRNAGKARELAALFDEPRIRLVPMSEILPADFDVPETETTFSGNAWLKALAVCKRTGLPALADDSGLEVDALGGRPGVYSARYAGLRATDEDNNRLLLSELAGTQDDARTARFRCVLSLAAPGPSGPTRVAESEGVVEGRIIHAPRGEGGFGYDPLFEPLEAPGVTTAEMPPERKNELSHRGRAARALLPSLRRFLDHQ